MNDQRTSTIRSATVALAVAAAAAATLALSGCRANQAARSTGGADQPRESRGFNLFSSPADVAVPAGTSVSVRLDETLDSGSAEVGDAVRGEVAEELRIGAHVVAPAGTKVTGRVAEARPAKRFGGQAAVAVDWQEIELPSGDRLPVTGRVAAAAKRQTGKDTAIIVGSTVGGAVLGDAVGGKDGDIAGAVIGGGAGTAVAARRGPEAELEAGRTVLVQVSERREVEPAS